MLWFLANLWLHVFSLCQITTCHRQRKRGSYADEMVAVKANTDQSLSVCQSRCWSFTWIVALIPQNSPLKLTELLSLFYWSKLRLRKVTYFPQDLIANKSSHCIRTQLSCTKPVIFLPLFLNRLAIILNFLSHNLVIGKMGRGTWKISREQTPSDFMRQK